MKRLSNGEFDISIKTLQYLEPILEQELRDLGATDITIGKRIVHTKGDLLFLYKCNLHLRTALRVLVPLIDFQSDSPDHLYNQFKKFPWDTVMNLDQTFAIDAAVHSQIYNLPHFAALRAKDALVDYFKDRYNERPNVDKDDPDVRFLLHIDENKVTLSLDSSGESLNRRGYRTSGAGAPLNEVLAAAMILMTGWKGESPFINPMCGSATLAIEAAFIATNKPSCWNRERFGFMTWKDFDVESWKEILRDAIAEFKPLQYPIHASDVDQKALRAAKANIIEAELRDEIILEQADFFELKKQDESGIIVVNPPYGERMDDQQTEFLYKRIGDQFKHQWSGYTAWLISSNMRALKNVGLRPYKKFNVMNGQLDCKFQGYELFRGERSEFVKTRKEGLKD